MPTLLVRHVLRRQAGGVCACVVDLFFLMFCLRVRASHDIP
jgi:hypothetical protein